MEGKTFGGGVGPTSPLDQEGLIWSRLTAYSTPLGPFRSSETGI